MEQNLLAVTVSRADFEYDIHSLVKAFYPERAVKVWQETDVRRQNSAKGSPQLHIAFEEDGIRAELLSQSGEKKTQRIEISSETPRPEVKNRLKRLLYQLLSEHSARTLPWGTLTGIRPVKIPMQLLDQGKGREEILNYLEETYYVSRGKGLLSLEIAHRERALLSSLHGQEGYSLYIGIPFCPTTCLYCSFTSYPIASWKKRVGEYLGALEKEIDFVARRYGDRILDTVYIGGGTPTTLEAAAG